MPEAVSVCLWCCMGRNGVGIGDASVMKPERAYKLVSRYALNKKNRFYLKNTLVNLILLLLLECSIDALSWFKDDTYKTSSNFGSKVYWDLTTERRFQDPRKESLVIHMRDAKKIFDN
ncbi:hypothetical protein ACNR91_004553 [Candidozyma auris]